MRFGNDLPGVHFLNLLKYLLGGFSCVFHNIIRSNCLEVRGLYTFLELFEPRQKPFQCLRGRIPARKAVQKILEKACEVRPRASQRAAERSLDPRADHPAGHSDLPLQALTVRALGLQLCV